MAEITYTSEYSKPDRRATDWSAIWAGMFTFAAIWSVFGFLGFAIFAKAGQGSTGLNLSLGIWSMVLAIVAMYIAGRTTGRAAALEGAYDGLAHGMIMFGLSVTAATILILAGSRLFGSLTAVPVTNLSIRGPYLMTIFGGSSWIAFFALLLGWLAAMSGAASGGSMQKAHAPRNVTDMRPAA